MSNALADNFCGAHTGDVLITQRHRAARRAHVADGSQCGGLTGAICTEDHRNTFSGHFEVQASENLDSSVRSVEVFRFQANFVKNVINHYELPR